MLVDLPADAGFLAALPGTPAPARADFDLVRAFAPTPGTATALVGIGLLLIGCFGLITYSRNRDLRALAAPAEPVEVLRTAPDGAVLFASPDGVLPGEIGTVVDERVDVDDIAATVLDLAVRNYLRIEELAEDWRVVRLNPPDAALLSYEWAVHDLLVGERQAVLLSELGPLRLASVRDALYAEVVGDEWLHRRPDSGRSPLRWCGVCLAVAAAGLTVALARTPSFPLLGLAVTAAGVALAFGAGLLPTRTVRGSALVARVRGLRDYLRTTDVEQIPPADRETVFSRLLPYALVLAETDQWLAKFAELDPAAHGTPGLYWYCESATRSELDLNRFRERFPSFVRHLNAALAGSRASA